MGDRSDGGRGADGLLPARLVPRLDAKPWGGRRLADFGLPLPDGEPTGEALATAADSRVAGGPWAGRGLADLVAADRAGWLGERGPAATAGRPVFPLLVKLIDAAQDLSVQVHPDDARAAAAGHDRPGKTEAWHVLAADPGAALYLGLLPGVTPDLLETTVRAGGGAAHLLRRVPAVPGETVLLPAGTVHALGAGVLVYEVQQPSDLTYRLDDWGRLDAQGRPRDLHVDAGLAVLDPTSRPEPIPPIELPTPEGRRHLLAACRFFALERLALPAGGSASVAAAASPQTLTCLRGDLAVLAAETSIPLTAGETAALPAALGTADIRARTPTVLLRAWVPDLAAEVVAPARRAGAADAAIAVLGGPTGDVLGATIG